MFEIVLAAIALVVWWINWEEIPSGTIVPEKEHKSDFEAWEKE